MDGGQAKGVACGGAYFFQSVAGLWSEVVKVVPVGGSESVASEFGTSVSIDGSYAVVGAPGALAGTGEAYIYLNTGVTWALVGSP
jgi:hypothetical protein